MVRLSADHGITIRFFNLFSLLVPMIISPVTTFLGNNNVSSLLLSSIAKF